MSSPYTAPQSTGPLRSVVVYDRARLVMPRACVSCGATSDEFVQYTQDSTPIILPGIGLLQSTKVAAPYCAGHAADFRSRFIRLRWAQGLAYFVAILALIAAAPQSRQLIALPEMARLAGYVVGFGAFLFLVVSIFLIKPFLYDVFLTISGTQMRIRGAHPFLEQLIAANPGNAERLD
jgi:hypothetical protein